MSGSGSGSAEDPLTAWDPARRSALERVWHRFQNASGGARLSDQVIANRRRATAHDGAALCDDGRIRPTPDGEDSAGA